MKSERTLSTYERRLGARLQDVRQQQGLSLRAVGAASGHEFRADTLGCYERGERAISIPRLQRLATFYNMPVDQLLPPEASERWQGLPGEAHESDRTIEDSIVTFDLTRLDAVPPPEGKWLACYLRMIEVDRQDFNRRMLTVRRDDIRRIAWVFGITTVELRRRLDDLTVRL